MKTAQPLKYTLVAITTALLMLSMTVFAAPPVAPFTSGETLDPGCAPSDANCYVGASADNFANTDLVLEGDRIHDTSGFDLGITKGDLTFAIASDPLDLGIKGISLDYDDGVALPERLFIGEGGSFFGNADFINGDTRGLFLEHDKIEAILQSQYSGVGSFFEVRGGGATISGDTNLFIRTPATNATTATAGQVLTLADAATGEVEFATAAGGGITYSLTEFATPDTWIDGKIIYGRVIAFPDTTGNDVSVFLGSTDIIDRLVSTEISYVSPDSFGPGIDAKIAGHHDQFDPLEVFFIYDTAGIFGPDGTYAFLASSNDMNDIVATIFYTKN